MRPVVTLGTFDGVHLGHQHVLKETARLANELSTEAIVLTYLRHPMEVLTENQETECKLFDNQRFPLQEGRLEIAPTDNQRLPLLTEFSVREKLINQSGIEAIYYINFDINMSQKTASDFLENIIINMFNPQMIVVGYDTQFGVNRSGNAEFLRSKAKQFDFEVVELNPVYCEDKIISSSLIREMIKKGAVEIAALYLGYRYSIISEVVYGNQIGRIIGYPTINQQPLDEQKLIPYSGVYFTLTRFLKDKSLYFGATKVGVSPTIKTENRIEIETNLFDFSEYVYGQTVETIFIEKIRNEKKFNSVNELVEQIKIDTEMIKKMINNYDKTHYTSV